MSFCGTKGQSGRFSGEGTSFNNKIYIYIKIPKLKSRIYKQRISEFTLVLLVANVLGVSRTTIVRLMRKYRTTGTVKDLSRRPKRRVTTAVQDRYMTLHLRDRRQRATETASPTTGIHGRPISGQTVKNCVDTTSSQNELAMGEASLAIHTGRLG